MPETLAASIAFFDSGDSFLFGRRNQYVSHVLGVFVVAVRVVFVKYMGVAESTWAENYFVLCHFGCNHIVRC